MLITVDVNTCSDCPYKVFVEDDMGPWDYYRCRHTNGPESISNIGIIDPKCPIKGEHV